MKQIEYFAYTGQLEAWLASKGVNPALPPPTVEPTPEPLHQFCGCTDGLTRYSNHAVSHYAEIPDGGRWATRRRDGTWSVFESVAGTPTDVVWTKDCAEAEALIRERPVGN